MKEIIKNKAMIGFIIFMVVVSYTNSIQMKEVMKSEGEEHREIILNQN